MLQRPITCFPFFEKHKDAIKLSAYFQGLFLFLSAILLDGGTTMGFMMLAAVVYWIMLAIIMVRRNGNATSGDRFILKWGFALLAILTPTVISEVVSLFR